MTSARARRRLSLIGLVLISALAIGITSSQMPDHNASASRLADDGTPAVALIGNEPVSATEFKEYVAGVRSNLTYMHGQIAAGNQSSAFLQAFIDLINAHGAENVALSGLIEDQALYDLAVTRGFDPSHDVVQAKVAQDKALVAQSPDSAAAAYIASVGADRYWDAYPATVRRSLATQALWQHTVTGKPTTAGQVAAWNDVQQQALDATPVTILDANALAPATTAAAIDYLHAYWAFSGK